MATVENVSAVRESTSPAVSKRKEYSFDQQQRFWGWVFLSPWIIGFLAFTFFPIIVSLIFTFTDFELVHPEKTNFLDFDFCWTSTPEHRCTYDLDNWKKLTTDPMVGPALSVTIRYAIPAVMLSLIVPISIATLLNAKFLWGKRYLRTLFYLPYMVPAVSAIYIWGNFLNSEAGWLNRMLAEIGIAGPDWTNDVNFIYPALLMIELWGVGNAMLTTLATMQGVPTDLYEAAEVDGAGPFVRWRKITLPMISPVIFYNLILNAIGLMQYFVVPYVLSGGTGRPGNATYFFNVHLYKTAFGHQDMGYGATLAWVIFLIALVITVFLFSTARYWVFYSGDRS